MNRITTFLGLALVATSSLAAQQINEIFASHTGTDDMEFIELKGTPLQKLDGYMVLVVEGDGAGAGTLDRAWDLKGHSIPIDGYFVLGDNNVPGVDMKIGASNTIENGTDTFYLVKTSDTSKITALLSKNVDPDGDLKSVIPTLATIVDLIAGVDGGISTSDKTYDGAKRIGPDGSYLPAGFYRANDVSWCEKGFLDFDDVANKNAPSTAGKKNVRCAPASSVVKGKSCLTGTGTAGGPELSSNAPKIGKTFTSTVSKANSGSTGFLFAGIQANPSVNFLRCQLYLNPAAILNVGAFTFTTTNGELKLQLPYSTALLGVVASTQGAVSSSAGLHVTNYCVLTIGW